MENQKAEKLLDETFNQKFDIDRFANFIKELFNHFKFKKDFKTNSIPLSTEYQDYIEKLQSLGIYRDSNHETIEVFMVKLKRNSSIDKARTMQRNSIAKYLKKFNRNASLVAFYGDNPDDWRFSFVKVDYELFKDKNGNLKVDEKLTPAKRYSFLVGKNEPNHTCRSQFLHLIVNETADPNIEDIENSFSIENVTKEFFEEYKELYLRLVESLEKIIEKDEIIKTEFEEKNIIISDFAKKLMGQIVFIYFLQKKGWLGVKMDQEWGTGPKTFLRKLFDKKNYKNFFNDILEHLFYDALATDRYDDYYEKFECKIPFLNGGLFEPINLYNWRKTNIYLDNEIFENILETFDKFNFTVKEDEPLERVVAVDPEMLGKVFENLLEVKDRKSKGAFYTPREIVHYMCQQSLINYLDTNLDIPKKDIEQFINLGDFALDSIIRAKELKQSSKGYALSDSIKINYNLIDKLLREVKIVDPAVGSGAFLVGMMNEILKARSILSLLKDENNTNYDLKRETIENALYGVDIDSSAVDVTKLRFWLSLIVDEENIDDIKPLPNLDHKIMCGNSLLDEYNGIKLFDEKILFGDSSLKKEFVQSTLFDERLQQSRKKLKRLRELHKLYFNEQNKKQKDHYRDEIDEIEWLLIEETLKEESNEESLKELLNYKKRNSKPFFLWKLYFSEIFQKDNSGFDIAIANPPYVFTRGKNFSNAEKKSYSKKYGKIKIDSKGKNRKTQSGKLNLFTLFIEQSINLLKSNGHLTFIVPNNVLRTTTYDITRYFILDNCKIPNIIDLSSGVFDKVTAATIILILEKEKQKELRDENRIHVISDISSLEKRNYNDYSISQKSFIKNPSYAFNIYVNDELFDVFDKIRNRSNILSEYTKYITAGIATPKDKNKFISMEKKSKLYKKFLEGKDIKRYYIDYKGKYILYDREKLHRARSEEIYTSNEKILIPRISGGKRVIKAAFDNQQYYTFNSINNLLLKDSSDLNLKYILVLLNSNLINTYYNLNFTNKSELTVNISSTYLEQLPIYAATLNDQKPFIESADRMIKLYKDLIKEINSFQNWLNLSFNLKKSSQKLDKYYEISFDEFKIELKKKNVDIKSETDIKIMNKRFHESLKEIDPILRKIDQIDKKTNQMVYNLYGLTDNEIKIIEDNLID